MSTHVTYKAVYPKHGPADRIAQDLRALSADAAALVRSNVNVLVPQATEPALQAALGATRTCRSSWWRRGRADEVFE